MLPQSGSIPGREGHGADICPVGVLQKIRDHICETELKTGQQMRLQIFWVCIETCRIFRPDSGQWGFGAHFREIEVAPCTSFRVDGGWGKSIVDHSPGRLRKES